MVVSVLACKPFYTQSMIIWSISKTESKKPEVMTHVTAVNVYLTIKWSYVSVKKGMFFRTRLFGSPKI